MIHQTRHLGLLGGGAVALPVSKVHYAPSKVHFAHSKVSLATPKEFSDSSKVQSE